MSLPVVFAIPPALAEMSESLQRFRPRFLHMRCVARTKVFGNKRAALLDCLLPKPDHTHLFDRPFRRPTNDYVPRQIEPPKVFALKPNAPNAAPTTRGGHRGRWAVKPK